LFSVLPAGGDAINNTFIIIFVDIINLCMLAVLFLWPSRD
jgi:hypothetical protein